MARYFVNISDGENEITAISHDVPNENTALYSVIGGLVEAEIKFFKENKYFKCSDIPRVTPEYDYCEREYDTTSVMTIDNKPSYVIINRLITRLKREAIVIIKPLPSENSTFYLSNGKEGFVKPSMYVKLQP